MRKMKDPIKKGSSPRLERAFRLFEAWIDTELKDYQEPIRHGIHKGDPVGFPLKKQRAARLMLLYPLFRLHKIAEFAGVSPGVLRVWKIQDEFQKATKEASERLLKLATNTIQLHIEKSYLPENPELEKSWEDKPVFKIGDSRDPWELILDAVSFLNPELIQIPVMTWASKRFESPHTIGKADYLITMAKIIRTIHSEDKERFRKFIRQPQIVDINKAHIAMTINTYLDPKAFKRLKPEKLREQLKELIFRIIDEYLA